jgi:hypothetical protein
MKRKDLKPGERYVTSAGVVFEVVDTEPGWRVENGEWVADPQTATRFMPGKGHVPYQTNGCIRAYRIPGRRQRKVPVAIEPRLLVKTEAEWREQQPVGPTWSPDALRKAAAKQKMPPVEIRNGEAIFEAEKLAEYLGVTA